MHGPPGSGKSVILNCIGYKLYNEGESVFILPFKEKVPDWDMQKLEKICSFLNETQSYLFIDDIHLDSSNISEHIYNKLNKRTLFARRTPEIDIIESKDRINKLEKEFINSKPIKIEKTQVEEIINIFERIKKQSNPNFYIPENAKANLIKRYKNNLRLLALQLVAHKDDESIKRLKPIKRGIKNYIKEDLKIPGAENVLLPIALLYQFEIPIRKPFITELLGNDYNSKIIELCKKVEIVEFSDIEKGRDYLRMHHSEDAKVYVQAFDSYEDFGDKVKAKIQEVMANSSELKWYEKFYLYYLKKFPKEGWIVLPRISRYLESRIVTHPLFKKIMLNIFREVENLNWEIYEYFLYEAVDGAREIVRTMPRNIFKRKITSFKNPFDIAIFLGILEDIKYKHFKEIKKVKPEVFAYKIKNTDELEAINYLISILIRIEYNCSNLFNIIEPKAFEEKIKSSKNLYNIGYLIKALHNNEYNQFNHLINIQPDIFKEKIENWENPGDIAYLYEALFEVRYKYFFNNINNIGVDIFIDKIKNWNNLNDIAYTIETLNDFFYEHIEELKKIEANVFADKINAYYNQMRYSRFSIIHIPVVLISALIKIGYKNVGQILNLIKDEFREELLFAIKDAINPPNSLR